MLIRHGHSDSWHEPHADGFASEEALETLLTQSPFLLPWELSEGLVLARQVSLPPAGTADLIGVGLSGEIVLIECKLRSNAEIRRHILGQIFAYASALWQMSYESFASQWGAAKKAPLAQAAHEVAVATGAEWNEDDFRSSVSANLQSGRFRLLVAVDAITDELARIIEYVNRHTVPDLQILGLQVEYRSDGDVEILSPTVYGGETVRSVARSAAAQNPDLVPSTEENLFQWLSEGCSAAGMQAVRRLYDWSTENGMRPTWGTGQHPSVTAWFDVDGVSIAPWSCWASKRDANVSVNFAWIAGRGLSDERVDRFLSEIQRIEGFGPKLANVREKDFRKRPGILIDSIWAQPGAMDAFGEALAELLCRRWTTLSSP